jgi:16S rRNA (guanine(966)-N(2))-methyltransferase RsmD
MRIISGKYGGRTFQPPANMPHTRPTTDLAKGGLFNIIENNLDIEGLKTLDLFGGTGSISYELASRGATDQTIVEKDPAMASFIQQISEKLGTKMNIVKMDVFKYMNQCNEQFDFIFAGPPYALGTIDELPKLVFEKKLLKEDGWFILEHTPRNNYQKFPFFRVERNYGTTIFSIFVNKPKEE